MKIFDIDKLLDTLTSYIETKLELFKIELKEEISALIAKAVILLAVVGLMIIALIFGLTALANWFNTLTESDVFGYLLVCGLILLMAFVVYGYRLKLQKRILKKIVEDDSSEEEPNEQ